MAWELVRLMRSTSKNLRHRLLSHSYRLSTAALLMGASNAVLYALTGVWPYTRLFGEIARHAAIGTPPPQVIFWLLFGALIVGIGFSAWQRREIVLQWRPRPIWAVYGIGGMLMGFGAATIPGGNDVLILQGIPSLSPHAIPAFLAMLGGIAVSLLSMRALGMTIPRVDCSGDICGAEPK